MKQYFTFFILLCGLLLAPTVAEGCVKVKEKKSCCSAGKLTSRESISCCHSISYSQDSCCSSDADSQDEKGCEGKCTKGTCSCSSTCSVAPVSFIFPVDYEYNLTVYFSYKTIQFLYTTPSLSEGFTSIWLIPKIS